MNLSQRLLFLGAAILLLIFIIIFWITRRQCKRYASKAAGAEKWHNTQKETARDAIVN